MDMKRLLESLERLGEGGVIKIVSMDDLIKRTVPYELLQAFKHVNNKIDSQPENLKDVNRQQESLEKMIDGNSILRVMVLNPGKIYTPVNKKTGETSKLGFKGSQDCLFFEAIKLQPTSYNQNGSELTLKDYLQSSEYVWVEYVGDKYFKFIIAVKIEREKDDWSIETVKIHPSSHMRFMACTTEEKRREYLTTILKTYFKHTGVQIKFDRNSIQLLEIRR